MCITAFLIHTKLSLLDFKHKSKMATSVMLRDAYHDAEVKNFNKGFETTFNIRLQQKQVR